MKMPRLVFIATCLLVLAACGNKGPLVLPQKPVPVSAQDPLPAPAEPVDSVPSEAVPASSSDDGDGTPR
ncbi:LPS translocon maturation chaperone LptM [Solilutibacter tolerans]|nr:lipoprotein [Lysobacter tolerans]